MSVYKPKNHLRRTSQDATVFHNFKKQFGHLLVAINGRGEVLRAIWGGRHTIMPNAFITAATIKQLNNSKHTWSMQWKFILTTSQTFKLYVYNRHKCLIKNVDVFFSINEHFLKHSGSFFSYFIMKEQLMCCKDTFFLWSFSKSTHLHKKNM